MGVVLSRAEVVRGLEPLTAFTIEGVRRLVNRYEECCPMPALWERAFHELLGCFSTPETCRKAFFVLDTDQNGVVDALELLGALAVVSKGHLSERMKLVYEIFDFNKEGAMAFDECFLMLRRTMGGIRKMVGIAIPPETVIHSMVKAVWNSAKKHRDGRITPEEWFSWWASDASLRSALRMVTWRPEENRGLPTPDQQVSIDYTRVEEKGKKKPRPSSPQLSGRLKLLGGKSSPAPAID